MKWLLETTFWFLHWALAFVGGGLLIALIRLFEEQLPGFPHSSLAPLAVAIVSSAIWVVSFALYRYAKRVLRRRGEEDFPTGARLPGLVAVILLLLAVGLLTRELVDPPPIPSNDILFSTVLFPVAACLFAVDFLIYRIRRDSAQHNGAGR